MSIRWMAVQYVGNTLRLPLVNEGDMDKPFGSSVVDREISRIVVNPFSDNPQTFVRESDYERLRELLADLAICACGKYCHGCPHQYDGCDRDKRLREMGIEVGL